MKLRLPALALLIAVLLSAQQDKHLTVYSPLTTHSVVILDRDGREYVGLVELLEPLGSTSGRLDGDTWKLHFNSAYAEFKPGKSKAKIRGKGIDLGAPFLLEDKNRGLIPLPSLAVVLSRIVATPVSVHESARRIFLGGAATQYTAEILKTAPSRLVLHFSAPVNPTIATEPGRLRMMFSREPVLAPSTTQSFDDKLITSATFAEHNGAAELTIAGTAPLLASFSDESRTITISAAPQPRIQAVAPPPVAPPAAAPPAAPAPAPPALRPRFLVVIDPGHGGDDRGAVLADSLVEKDVTLSWARRLRAALERQGIAVTLLRESDAALSAEQRAAAANGVHPAAFIAVHAGTGARGVHLYTAHLPDTTQKPGSFLPWGTAQAAFLDPSRSLAGSIAAELSKHEVPVSTAPVLMRPLTSVAAAAVALEVTAPSREVLALLAPEYQQSICAAVADGIAAMANGHAAVHGAPARPPEAGK